MDFNFEVSRSLAACQGTLLLVDAAQGIQAQTVANFYLAFGQDIKIIPVINKVLAALGIYSLLIEYARIKLYSLQSSCFLP